MKVAFLVAILTSICGCSTLHRKAAMGEERSSTKKLTLLTFNVENLFDLQNDPAKNDDAFLPKAKKSDPIVRNNCYVQNDREYRQSECLTKDWSRRVLARKMSRLTDVLKQVEGGKGPDILILQEVENIQVLEQWRDQYLKDMNYRSIALIEGPDTRGIDTAVMSRLPLIHAPILHEITPIAKMAQPEDVPQILSEGDRPPELERATRGILQADLRLPDGQQLSVFSVHFPAQGNPTEYRKHSVDTLLGIIKKLPAETLTVVGGDFNITASEDWEKKYFSDYISKEMIVSHLVGCKGCVGSTYYHKTRTWSFFDVILFSKDFMNEVSDWRLNPDSIRIVNSSRYQINRYGNPARFGSGLSSVGVSDHWPLYAEIEYQPKRKLGAR